MITYVSKCLIQIAMNNLGIYTNLSIWTSNPKSYHTFPEYLSRDATEG